MAGKESGGASKKTPPLVSIITPSYNQAGYIGRTMESVLSQDYGNIEYIVVDGGSTDGTLSILRKCNDNRMRFVSEADKGQSDAINKGFRMAKGEIVAWLNSDDTYEQGAVRVAAEYLAAHPEAAMVYSRASIIDGDDRKTGEHFMLPYSNFVQVNIANCVPQQGVFMRRAALEKAGLVDQSLHYVMDHELWIRMGKVGKIAQIPGIWSNFRIVTGTKTSENYDKFFDEIITVCRRNGGITLFWALKKRARSLADRLGLLHAAKSARDSVLSLARK